MSQNSRRRFRSFSDPDTHFALIRSKTSIDVDGFRRGEPTGEVECEECGHSASAPEYIAHGRVDGEQCPQSNVTSEYYEELHST